MEDLLEKALIYQEFAATKANAYYAMAGYCRRNHLRLGVVATVVSALVGTAVFAGLVTQLKMDGKQPYATSFGVWELIGYVAVALFSVSAPVLTGLQTFLKYSEQAEKHKATAVGYDRLRQRMDLFRLRFSSASDSERATALKEFQEIASEFGSVAESSLTIPDHVYDAAARKRRTRMASDAAKPN